MRKQLFFKTSIKRTNPIKAIFLSMFNIGVGMPVTICETFTRKDFGIRHWNIGWPILYSILLILIPIYGLSPAQIFQTGAAEFDNFIWYLFVAAFVYKSVMHWLDQRHNPSTFDFGKHSYYGGKLDKRLLEFKFDGKKLDIRTIETIIEPAFFFCIGLILFFLHLSVGFLLLFASIGYSASRFMDYHLGDEKVLDIIDSIIIKEDYEDAFMNEISEDNSRGLNIPSRRPKSMENRRKVVEEMFLQDDEELRTYVA
ncbi:hypothetical protein OQX63_17245 [Pedobacter sp. PF22-3]|uniref:hypothetical protein n=1 Tax=Pedobacter sp. PF22-3 TaxID=2994467 RepID=UPI00224726BD|nr:hypothetical protein [Pedobacter sp. PF22-3]MCX2495239.1 hypothetical protein [Pedobacter sp. PF22-3]